MRTVVFAKPASAILGQLHCMDCLLQTPECHHWLDCELNGYPEGAALPWYRIVACRQRGHFINLLTGQQFVAHIPDCALSQRDLGGVRFIYAREPLAHYLPAHQHELVLWPGELLDDYRLTLLTDAICLQAWQEPEVSIREQVLTGINRFISDYPRYATLCAHHGFKAMQHRQWHF